MTLLKVHRNLTDPNGLKSKALRTHAGQAHFAGSGPSGKTCAECASFEPKSKGVKGECRRFRQMMSGRGVAYPCDAAACKYYEAAQ